MRLSRSSIAAIWFFSVSLLGPIAGSVTPTGVPPAEHCTIVSLRLSPSGVNNASSKLCPLHLMHVETAISASPFPPSIALLRQFHRNRQLAHGLFGSARRSSSELPIFAEHSTACYRNAA